MQQAFTTDSAALSLFGPVLLSCLPIPALLSYLSLPTFILSCPFMSTLLSPLILAFSSHSPVLALLSCLLMPILSSLLMSVLLSSCMAILLFFLVPALFFNFVFSLASIYLIYSAVRTSNKPCQLIIYTVYQPALVLQSLFICF